MNSPEPKNNKSNQPGKDLVSDDQNNADAAREEAMDDIEQDADLSVHSPNDDLDEGETARLGEDTDLV